MNRGTCFAYSFSMFIGNGFIINLWIQERGIKWGMSGTFMTSSKCQKI